MTRHPGTLGWLEKNLYPSEHPAQYWSGCLNWSEVGWETDHPDHCPPTYREIPVRAEVGPDDVRGKHVVGNLPLHLAALATSVTAVEFAGDPPRGREYGAAEMEASGARLATYRVVPA